MLTALQLPNPYSKVPGAGSCPIIAEFSHGVPKLLARKVLRGLGVLEAVAAQGSKAAGES